MSAGILHQGVWLAGAVAAVAINALWEGALLVACVWLLLRVWPRLNAATRYMVWSATLVAVAIVPIATTVPFLAPQPPSAVAAGTAAMAPVVTHGHTAVPAAGVAKKPLPARSQTVALQTPASPAVSFPARMRMTLPVPVALAIFAIWALLALYSFLRLAIGLYRLEQLKRDALPLPVEYRDAMARWTEVNKGSREVRLCVSDEIDVPVAVGLFDSMILIPRALMERLSEAEVDQISLHELAHLRRADDWTNGLQRVLTALFAWNPAVAFIGQQLDLEREVACDDFVLTLTGLVRPYALCLTKMAETSSWPHRPMPAPGVFATRKHISLRIERLLGAGRNVATTLSFGPAAATIVIVGALAFAMQLVAPSIAAPIDASKSDVDSAATTTHGRTAPVKTREVIRYVRVASNDAAQQRNSPFAPPPATAPVMHANPAPAPNLAMVPMHDAAVKAQQAAALGLSQMRIAQTAAAKVHSDILASVGARLGAARVADASSVRQCSGCDMAGMNWAGRDMHGVSYTGVDLSRSNLEGTNFSGGSFNGVDFSHANLHGASFRNAKLTGCDFSNANLTGVDFAGATMSGCQFTGAELASADVRSILNTCTGCDFTGANLSGLDLSHIRTNGIDFSRANLSGANLSDAQFTGVDFGGARLDGANLTNTVFNGCDLGRVDLTHVDLSRAKLIGTDLSSRGSPRP